MDSTLAAAGDQPNANPVPVNAEDEDSVKLGSDPSQAIYQGAVAIDGEDSRDLVKSGNKQRQVGGKKAIQGPNLASIRKNPHRRGAAKPLALKRIIGPMFRVRTISEKFISAAENSVIFAAEQKPTEGKNTTETANGGDQKTFTLMKKKAPIIDFADDPYSLPPRPTNDHPQYRFRQHWDPFFCDEMWDASRIQLNTRSAIQGDFLEFKGNQPPGVHIYQRKEMSMFDVLIVGPDETSYAGGFFHFVMRCPPNYRREPPRIRLMTTDKGMVSFGPTLCSTGKVLLPLNNTWHGSLGLPHQTILTLLTAVNSMFEQRQDAVEPNDEKLLGEEEDLYAPGVEHETLRVAVAGFIDQILTRPETIPQEMTEAASVIFVSNFETYKGRVLKLMGLEGRKIPSALKKRESCFQPKAILEKLNNLLERINTEKFSFLAGILDAERDTLRVNSVFNDSTAILNMKERMKKKEDGEKEEDKEAEKH